MTDLAESSIDTKRDDLIAGLRALAGFYEQHPTFPLPSYAATFNVYAADAETFALIASKLGGQRKKHGAAEFFGVTRRFGPLSLEVYTNREQVCERIVTGTEKIVVPDPDAPLVTVEREVVEWICRDSILGGAE